MSPLPAMPEDSRAEGNEASQAWGHLTTGNHFSVTIAIVCVVTLSFCKSDSLEKHLKFNFFSSLKSQWH